jgi:hypothetical protein
LIKSGADRLASLGGGCNFAKIAANVAIERSSANETPELKHIFNITHTSLS